ncbi:PAS domain-containing sensor histidine kinase [Nordella sp. HKS 07]|uniref:sensor histidine kinase NtrY-like n=1 Tax=Nordella sp. HKS 07 TaxID=2712222 RepID=UPI0013E17082|nr:PAS domain-containing sensor histidine kinase [Nordella sp. HKS 07]QIG51177.1 PAS domain-containing sensor histidine kinase [Nordella sp. HKS 07]
MALTDVPTDQNHSTLSRLPAMAGVVVVVLAILSGLATYTILTGLSPIKPTPDIITWLLGGNLALVLIMIGMILWQMWSLLVAKRRGTAGAGLHIRLVSLFSIIAALPALIVAAFAAVTLNRGLDAWFSERTRSIVDSAVTVAEAYMRDHGETARGDIASIAADLNNQKLLFDTDRPDFVRRVARHAALRGLVGAFVFDTSHKRIDANITLNNKIAFRAPPQEALERADKGELVVMPPGEGGNIIRALIKLTNYPSEYLYVYRAINPSVIDQLDETRAAKAEYDQLLEQRSGVQITFALMYAGVSLIFLLAAIWLGLWFADRIVAPVVSLLSAARRVSAGDLDAKVTEMRGPGDLQTLARAFNRMTYQLKEQRNELMTANHQLDERRRFTEAMLSGVTAGVIGVEPDGAISLINPSAFTLLGMSEQDLLGRNLAEVLPSFSVVFEQAAARVSGWAEGQVNMRVGTQERNFVVRVTTEASDSDDHGYVVTFDDISQLVSAQRNSAWADIARRIAHEIKNPLTPIQLSAERLKRKYGREIQTDKQVFEQCTDTIIRQVGDIGRMVDEFSAFARMPSASLETQDLVSVVREATILQRVAAGDLEIDVRITEERIEFAFDRRLVTQAVTNLVKNAREAIEARPHDDQAMKGRILVEAGIDAHHAPFIVVTDNGIGLPKENRHRLTEPYMTTRVKGTGLGLAIVKRIMEEHQGTVLLDDAPQDFDGGRGARVTLSFTPVLDEQLAVPAQ